jgi:hypothetical protein
VEMIVMSPTVEMVALPLTDKEILEAPTYFVLRREKILCKNSFPWY